MFLPADVFWGQCFFEKQTEGLRQQEKTYLGYFWSPGDDTPGCTCREFPACAAELFFFLFVLSSLFSLLVGDWSYFYTAMFKLFCVNMACHILKIKSKPAQLFLLPPRCPKMFVYTEIFMSVMSSSPYKSLLSCWNACVLSYTWHLRHSWLPSNLQTVYFERSSINCRLSCWPFCQFHNHQHCVSRCQLQPNEQQYQKMLTTFIIHLLDGSLLAKQTPDLCLGLQSQPI